MALNVVVVVGGGVCRVVAIVEIADLLIFTISTCFNLTKNTKHHPFYVDRRRGGGSLGRLHKLLIKVS